MTVKTLKLFGSILVTGALVLSPAIASAEGPDIFKAQKCNDCHSISVAGIASKDTANTEKAPDLSHVGKTMTKQAIAGFVLKKTEMHGEKHKKLFGGTTDELKVVATWLESLK